MAHSFGIFASFSFWPRLCEKSHRCYDSARDAVRKSMRAIRSAIGTPTITPELLISAEKLRYESYLRREDTNAAIAKLARDGLSIKQIVHRLGHSRNTVRQTLRGGRTDMFQTRQRLLDPYYLFLEDQWSGGRRNGAELWRRLQAQGFGGSLRAVGEWATRRRRSEAVSKQTTVAEDSLGQSYRAFHDHQTKLHDQG